MAVLEVYSPGELNSGTGGSSAVSQFIANPWATSDNPASPVWIQCTPAGFTWGESDMAFGIGILQLTYVDANGYWAGTDYGNVSDLQDNLSTIGFFGLPTRLFVPAFISVEILVASYNCNAQGSVALYLWG
jgi:hypothetical protein